MLDDNIVKPLIHKHVYAIVSGFCQNLSEISIFCSVLKCISLLSALPLQRMCVFRIFFVFLFFFFFFFFFFT